MRVLLILLLMVGCAEPVVDAPPRRDAGARPSIAVTSDGGNVDAGLQTAARDGGLSTSDGGDEGFDAGLIIDEPFDGGGSALDAGCSCTLKLPRPDQGGIFVGGVGFICGASLCSASGVLDFGCDAQGVPQLPDCPTPHPCTCTISPGRRMRCDTSACGGPPGAQLGYTCSASGQLSGPTPCP